MKIRNGFVSNSSTTSFCIVGRYIEDVTEELRDQIDTKKVGTKLEIYSNPNDYGDSVYLGLPIEEMDDNETLANFKAKAAELIATVLSKNILEVEPVSILSGGWYDG